MKSIFEAYAKIQESNPAQAGIEAAKRDAQKPYVSLVDGEWILVGPDGKDVKNYGKDRVAAQSALKDMFDEGAMSRLDYANKNPEEAENVNSDVKKVMPSLEKALKKERIKNVRDMERFFDYDGGDIIFDKIKDEDKANMAINHAKELLIKKYRLKDHVEVSEAEALAEQPKQENDAYNRLAKYVELWFDTYGPGTAPAGHEWANFMADHGNEMSDDKGLPLMIRGYIMWTNAKAAKAGMKKESVVARRRRRGTSVHGNMVDAKMPSLKKAMHIASDNDEFVKLIASDPTLLKALMAAVAPSPEVDMDVKADIHDLKK
jgi:hypothetical protein